MPREGDGLTVAAPVMAAAIHQYERSLLEELIGDTETPKGGGGGGSQGKKEEWRWRRRVSSVSS